MRVGDIVTWNHEIHQADTVVHREIFGDGPFMVVRIDVRNDYVYVVDLDSPIAMPKRNPIMPEMLEVNEFLTAAHKSKV